MKFYLATAFYFLLIASISAQFLNGDFSSWESVAGNEKPKYWDTNQLPEINSIFKVENDNDSWLKFDPSSHDDNEIYGSINQIILREDLPSEAVVNFSLKSKSLEIDSSTYFRLRVCYLEVNEEVIDCQQWDSTEEISEFTSFSLPLLNIDAEYIAFYMSGGLGLSPFGGIYGLSIVELDDVYISVNTSTMDKSHGEITVFPNPVSDILHINNQSAHESNYMIVDSFGRVISPLFFDNQRVVSRFLPGSYYLLVDNKEVIRFEKL